MSISANTNNLNYILKYADDMQLTGEAVDCIKKNTVVIKNEDIEHVRQYAFYECENLTTIDLPSVISVESEAFYRCSSLTMVNLPLATNISARVFQKCTSLASIILPSVITIYTQAFSNCTQLVTVDLPVASSMLNTIFDNCTALTTLILRNTEQMCAVGSSNVFRNTPIASGTGYIYVPSALIDSYTANTNWSSYAAQFRALEDYTVDGTVTGELDETKI